MATRLHAGIRLAEVLGSLSLATDIADGFPLEKCIRTCVLSTRLAIAHGCSSSEAGLAFWSGLLRFTGCTSFAHEEGHRFAAGDDISLRRTLAMVDFGRPATFVARAIRGVAPDATAGARLRAVGALLTTPSAPRAHAHAQCEAGIAFAKTIDMPDVAGSLRFREERWDGRGPRKAAAAEALPLAARISDVADVAELFAWNYGIEEASEEVRRRRGGALDPSLCDTFLRERAWVMAGIFEPSAWELFLETEPEPRRVAEHEEAIDRALLAFSRIADLTSAFTLRHSERVAEAAEGAAVSAGLDEGAVTLARRAGLAHDLGRVAVPVGIWDKPGALTPFERERVRQHSFQTETILRLGSGLHELADVAGATHERASGKGYHRRLRSAEIPRVARLVAAADVFVALGSDRPQRPKRDRSAIEREMLAMVASGELDRPSIEAVLATPPRPRPRSARGRDLTPREIDIVKLVAIGRTNPEIGALLGISPRTAQKHVMNVYEKVGLESRAGLALFAMENGLLDEPASS